MKQIPNIELIVEEYRSLQLSKSHLEKLNIRLVNESKRLSDLEKVLAKEYKDVLNVEPLSIKGVFLKVLGNQEEQYELEKQEYLMAALQYNEAKKLVDLLVFEKEVLTEKLKNEDSILNRFNKLVEDRNLFIDSEYPLIASQLQSISQQLDHNIAFRRELSDVLIVAIEVEDTLRKMIEYFNDATSIENWGVTWREVNEINYVRNLAIDNAIDLSSKMKQLLQELEDQLEDVYQFKSIRRFSKFEEFHYFNDIYYDRLISDWIVKKKIDSSINFLVGTIDSIALIEKTLKNQQLLTGRTISYLQSRQKDVILHGVK